MGSFMSTVIGGVVVLGTVAILAIQVSLGDKGEAEEATDRSQVLKALADLADQASKKIRDSNKSSKKDESSDPESAAKLKALQARLDAIEAERRNERAAFNEALARKTAVSEADDKAKGAQLTGSSSVVPATLAALKPNGAPEKGPSVEAEEAKEAEEMQPRVVESPQSANVCVTEASPRRQGLIRRIFGRFRIFSCFRR